MKKFLITLMMAFASEITLSQVVDNNDWVKINSTKFADEYISKRSIIINKDEVVAWTKYEFSEPIKPNSKTRPLWKENTLSAFASNRSFDCRKISSALNKSGIYNDKKEFFSIDENEKPQSDKTLAAPDSSIYQEIKRICDFAKFGKIDNKGWELVPYERYKEYKDKLDEQRVMMRKELEDGTYGEEGALSKAGLKRFSNIINIEDSIEKLSINNIHALEYTASRYLNDCTSMMQNNGLKFPNTDKCVKAKSYVEDLASKGKVTSQITLIGINITFYKDSIDYEKSLSTLYSIDVSKLNSVDAKNHQWITDGVKENLTQDQIALIKKSITKRK